MQNNSFASFYPQGKNWICRFWVTSGCSHNIRGKQSGLWPFSNSISRQGGLNAESLVEIASTTFIVDAERCLSIQWVHGAICSRSF